MVLDFESSFTVPTITAKELIKLRSSNKQYLIVDVRESYERKVSIIPEAISKHSFETNKEKHKNKKIISYCTIGVRSGYYTKELRNQGFNAWNLRGSILMWLHENEKLTTPEGQNTKKVHLYGKPWDLAPTKNESTTATPWWIRFLRWFH